MALEEGTGGPDEEEVEAGVGGGGGVGVGPEDEDEEEEEAFGGGSESLISPSGFTTASSCPSGCEARRFR